MTATGFALLRCCVVALRCVALLLSCLTNLNYVWAVSQPALPCRAFQVGDGTSGPDRAVEYRTAPKSDRATQADTDSRRPVWPSQKDAAVCMQWAAESLDVGAALQTHCAGRPRRTQNTEHRTQNQIEIDKEIRQTRWALAEP